MCGGQNSLSKGGLKYGWYYYSHTKDYTGFLSFNGNKGNNKELKSWICDLNIIFSKGSFNCEID